MSASAEPRPQAGFSVAATDESCRLPLLVLFVSAAVWLLVSSLLGFTATLKFHSSAFLADSPWLTYGRVRPAATVSMLYGFCIQSGLGVMLWLFSRLGRTLLAQPWLVLIGAVLWNIGVTIGTVGILGGESTGFETLEIPSYAALILFLAYLMIGIWAVLTFHQRTEPRLTPSHWFLLAALFWFPWIFSSAYWLLVVFPVRGIAQSVIAWWYSNNLHAIWLGFVGLGTLFYFIPKFSGRPLRTYYLAVLSFWLLIIFGSWGGIPHSAPVPAWMPALSTVGTGLTTLPLVIVGLIIYETLGRLLPRAADDPSLKFVWVGAAAFLVAGLMKVVGGLWHVTDLTWFIPAKSALQSYGFFAMVMFGAIYYIVPQLTGVAFPSARLVRLHYLLAVLGIVLSIGPLAIGGVFEGMKLHDPRNEFMQVAKGTLMFLRLSSIGDLLLIVANGIFLINHLVLVGRLSRARAAAAYGAVTAEMKPLEVRS